MASEPGTSATQSSSFWRTPWPWAFLLGAVLLVAIRPFQEMMKSAPPPLAQPGEWSLIGHQGTAFSSTDLQGRVWIGNFIFTRCPSICPKLTGSMKKMHQSLSDLGDQLQFVSFTVDPEFDQPQVLQNYREKMEIVYPNWTFLTGEKDALHTLLVKKFFVPVGEKVLLGEKTRSDAGAASVPSDAEQTSQLFDISHSGKLVLFDQNGDIRAYADATPLGMGSLANAARLLVKQGPNP